MNELSVNGLGKAIVREHQAAQAAAVRAIEHAIEAGRLLVEAKQHLPHGEFEGFVKNLGTVSQRTATLYMRLHRRQAELGNRQRVAGLSMREADRLLRLTVHGTGRPSGAPSARQRAEECVAESVADKLHQAGAVEASGLLVWFDVDWLERDERPQRHAILTTDHDVAEVELPAGVELHTSSRVKATGCPSWYTPGQWAEGVHVDGWLADVWPHPGGPEWVHWAAAVPGVAGSSHMIGAKRGVRLERLRTAMTGRDGLPDVDGSGWDWVVRPANDPRCPDSATFNTRLYCSAAEYAQLELS